jgi:hypothetical protein
MGVLPKPREVGTMKKIGASVLGTLFLLAAAVPGLAATEQKVEKLRDKQERLARNAAAPGKKKMLYKQMNRRIDGLLERLESGEQVDPSEIDALLRRNP